MSRSLPTLTTRSLAQPSRRTLLASALGLVGGGLLTGCGGGSSGSTAALRFVNATVDFSTADFWAGGNDLISGLANGGTPTGWYSVNAASDQIELHATGSSSAQLAEAHSFTSNTYTTAVAYGALSGSVKFTYFTETDAAPGSGSTNVRVFQGASNLTSMDVYITNTSSLSGLSPTFAVTGYETLTNFVTLSAGNYRIRITASGNQSNVLYDYTTQVTLDSAAVITLVVAPRSSGSLPNITALAEQGGSALLANTLVT